MSLVILHGEHEMNSRAALACLIETFSNQGLRIVRLDADGQLVPAILEQELGSVDMFGSDKVVIIDRLHSLLKSKRKDELIGMVAQFSQTVPVVLWENKKLTATQLKKFPKADVQLFALSPVLFKWLDALHQSPPQRLRLLQTALKQDGAEFCFAMLARQIRQLLLTKTGAPMKDAPWTLKKLQSQARVFTLEQLISIHDKLTHMDYSQKTGRAKLTLDQELEQLMIKMN